MLEDKKMLIHFVWRCFGGCVLYQNGLLMQCLSEHVFFSEFCMGTFCYARFAWGRFVMRGLRGDVLTVRTGNSLIRSSLIRTFAHFAQIK